jgi:NAD(P)-dependent dehydrogenase (short-subunit alcohol dehydrogenase family)
VALEKVKRIDYVFANAGVLESTYLGYTPAEKVEFVEPDMTTINVNVTGALFTCQLAAQVFRTQELVEGFRGKMVVTASVA